MRDSGERLDDILTAIAGLERHSARGEAALLSDELLQAYFLKQLEIIGEAVRYLPESMTARHPEVPWRQIVALRNLLVHAYFAVNLPTIWDIVTRDLAPLRAAVEALKDEV